MDDERLGRVSQKMFNISGLAWNSGVHVPGLVKDLSGVGKVKETLRRFRGLAGVIWGVFRPRGSGR